jgi:hypothetical protein
MRRFSQVIVLLAGVALTGCNAFGPRAVEGTRVAYNEVLARTQDEQLLLNIVRLRYVDVPMFLEVASINTQFEFRTDADASISGEFGDSLSEYTGSTGVGFSVIEKPTVSYVPLQGDDFVKQLMAPVDLDTIVLMTRGGWSAHRVLRVCAQSLCGLPNAPTAAGPAHDNTPIFERFQRAVKLLREQQLDRVARLRMTEDGKYELQLDTDHPNSDELHELLGLEETGVTPLRAGSRREPGVVTVEPRSLLGAMFYLSQGIELPPPQPWLVVLHRRCGHLVQGDVRDDGVPVRRAVGGPRLSRPRAHDRAVVAASSSASTRRRNAATSARRASSVSCTVGSSAGAETVVSMRPTVGPLSAGVRATAETGAATSATVSASAESASPAVHNRCPQRA